MTRGQHAHYARPGTGISSRVRQICSSPASTVCAALIALTLLACIAPPASGSDDLCDRSLHAGYTKYELMEVPYEIEGGKFLGLCVNSENGVFEIFLDAEPDGELVLEMPSAWFDPRQFDRQACDFGYGINGSSSRHNGVRTEIDEIVDQRIVVGFSWDVQVSQISYTKSPAMCLEKHDVLDGVWDTPLSALKGWLYGDNHLSLDVHCVSPNATIIRLNHTMSNGKLDRICTIDSMSMTFYISPETFGELIVDIPNDVFPLHHSGYDGIGLTDSNGKPINDVHDDYPFVMTTWNKYGIPYSTVQFYHTEYQFYKYEGGQRVHWGKESRHSDGVSKFEGCLLHSRHACFPIPFFWGRPAYKISSHDSFDRYSIPFGADDAKIELWTYLPTPMALYYDYHPEKYRIAAGALLP